ncbi:CsbD family protein [Streptomyces brevispora]|uniref:CsbD family protein n=1 Tax=Streptomyces brevispora TaxID=887462 RepID=A0A561UZZ5_9ACTN|nr:CsbD family protein [Streptomyces brevispora]TWG04914.1 hypothetical protein FHX80_113386 [Streptomyces brevispora]WSC14030.1 CsbD family protein [Streptomyces brevispora]
MTADEKAQAKGEPAEGKVKKVVGRAVGNESMQAEGRADENVDDLRQANAKDAIKE